VLADLGVPQELLLAVPPEEDPGFVFHSPEELQGRSLDARSTVYSLGVLLYTALTRAQPYEGPWSRVHSALLAGAAPRPSARWAELPPGINRVIARAIAPDSEQRYADPMELARAAEEALRGGVSPAKAPADLGPDQRPPRPLPPRVPVSPKPKARPAKTASRQEVPTQPLGQERPQLPQAAAPEGEGHPSKSSSKLRPAPKPRSATNRPAVRRPKTPRGPGEINGGRKPTRRNETRPVRRPAEAAPEPRRVGEAQTPAPAAPEVTSSSKAAGWIPRLADGVVTRSAAAARLCAALVGALLTLAGAGARRFRAAWHRFAAVVVPAARGAARTVARGIRRGANAIAALLVRASRAGVAAARRVARVVGDVVPLVGAVGQRGSARLRQAGAAVGSAARSAARTAGRAFGRGAGLIATVLRRARRVVVPTGRGAIRLVGILAVAAGALLHRVGARLLRVLRSARMPWRGASRRVDRPTRIAKPLFVGPGPRARRRAANGSASVGQRGRVRRPSFRGSERRPFSTTKVALAAVAAIVASGLSGIALGGVLESDRGPSSVTRSGLTVTLPRGWEPAETKPGRLALMSPIAAVPSGRTEAGFVLGRLSSQRTAERMFEGVQHAGEGRTRVRLGKVLAWRYAGLRPGPRLVGTGYLVPTTGGAVVMLCHAAKHQDRARLAQCARSATTLVVAGERSRELPSVDRSRQQLIGVIARLRSSRSAGRRRLAAAELAPGQIRAAISLKVSHQRAARSVEQIPPLENGHSLGDMATALRAAAAAYGRLAVAAAVGSASTYREAGRAVAREEEAMRRELARVGAP
jgi:hypothetical protein